MRSRSGASGFSIMAHLSALDDMTIPNLCRDAVTHIVDRRLPHALRRVRKLQKEAKVINGDFSRVERTYVQAFLTRAWDMLLGQEGDVIEKLRRALDDI